MTASERGFLLLCSDLGDGMQPLSLYQLELLRRRMTAVQPDGDPDVQITPQLLQKLGYRESVALRLAALLDREKALEDYLSVGAEKGCFPLTCISDGFPQELRSRLGRRCPAVLFYRGEMSLLRHRRIAAVGSRNLSEEGRVFAERIGQLAAGEGYTLVSGNARGADRTAQEACLRGGGSVIAVVSEPLSEQPAPDGRLLYLSESGWHQPFSAARALGRNRLIYALGEKCFVAQCTPGSGTWKGARDALRHGLCDVIANDDCSEGAAALRDLGAILTTADNISSLSAFSPAQTAFLPKR